MKNTLESFKQKRGETLEILNGLREFLLEGESYGIQIDEHVKKKLNGAIQNVQDEKLRVVLVGGFSEGKTAIAAAWLEKFDVKKMHISHEESSNAIEAYDTGTDCILIDTPGLFGFKEQMDNTSGKIEKYRELTQRHISQAHLILYVMDPTNPVKESHREELNWMFRELALLPRTIFVLSRFDDVADIEDAQDYAHHVEIKRGNVASRLRDILALDDQETADLTIVAVAANPFDKGSAYWLERLEEFRQLSRIPLLQAATSEKIRQAGGVQEIVDDARRSVVSDVLHTQLPIAIQNFDHMDREVGKLRVMHDQLAQELSATNGHIAQIKISLRDFVNRFFSDLILHARHVDMETVQDFFENHIGSEGVILESTLKNAFERHLGSVQLSIDNMAVSFNTEVNYFNASMTQYAKMGVNHIAQSGMINNATIIAGRDFAVNAAKVVGLDIGKFLKFQPWGAVKTAKGAGMALAAVGLLLEGWDSWQRYKQEEKFREAIDIMVKNFETQRKNLLSLIDDESFVKNCLPDFVQLRHHLDALEKQLDDRSQQRKNFEQWRAHGEAIEVQFRKLH